VTGGILVEGVGAAGRKLCPSVGRGTGAIIAPAGPVVSVVGNHLVDGIHGFLEAVFREVHRGVVVEGAIGDALAGRAEADIAGEGDGDHGGENQRHHQDGTTVRAEGLGFHGSENQVVTRLLRRMKRAESTVLEAAATVLVWRVLSREIWSCLVLLEAAASSADEVSGRAPPVMP